jgi:hypothetical protein
VKKPRKLVIEAKQIQPQRPKTTSLFRIKDTLDTKQSLLVDKTTIRSEASESLTVKKNETLPFSDTHSYISPPPSSPQLYLRNFLEIFSTAKLPLRNNKNKIKEKEHSFLNRSRESANENIRISLDIKISNERPVSVEITARHLQKASIDNSSNNLSESTINLVDSEVLGNILKYMRA